MPLSNDITAFLPWTIITFSVDRALLITDQFNYLILTGATARTVTIPPNSDVAFRVGTQISFKQNGTGLLTFAAGGGVTLESRGGLLDANGQFAVMSIVQDSADIWSLFGDLA